MDEDCHIHHDYYNAPFFINKRSFHVLINHDRTEKFTRHTIISIIGNKGNPSTLMRLDGEIMGIMFRYGV